VAEVTGAPVGGAEGSGAGDRPVTLHQAAVRHGAYRWAEHRLFELTGGWASAPGVPPAARVHLFEASAQHAWHATLWYDRLPVLAGVERDRLTRPLGPVLAPLMAALGEPPEPGPATEGGTDSEGAEERALGFLAGLYRVVLPRLVDSYRRHGRRLAPSADGPSIRAVSLVVRDEEEQLAAGGAIVEELAGRPGLGRAVREATERIGQVTAGIGPDTDLVPWPDGRCAW
jgi:hypothetical protein